MGSDDLKIVYSGGFFPELDESEIQDKDYHFLSLYTTGSEMYALMEWHSGTGAALNGMARITASENGELSEELLP